MKKIKHVLGISGGKDSAALAIYLNDKYPQIDIIHYFCDTEKELDETYKLVENLESYLGNKVIKLKSAEKSPKPPFDHFLEIYGGYLPSSQARWCTKHLKIKPFEKFVGNNPTVSYVGIRGDEDREGYISRKSNIQSIFPFRKNIWSEDVIKRVLRNDSTSLLKDITDKIIPESKKDEIISIIDIPLSFQYPQVMKLNDLLSCGIVEFNKIVFDFLKVTQIPLAYESDFPLIENDEILVRGDIFKILEKSGIGVPEYYKKIEYTVEGKKGYYARSRSGCFFCFFQQKIEWIWLYENHPDKFWKAVVYEKDGYTWMRDEGLKDLIKSERVFQIKEDHLKNSEKKLNRNQSIYLLDILIDAEKEGCPACFI